LTVKGKGDAVLTDMEGSREGDTERVGALLGSREGLDECEGPKLGSIDGITVGVALEYSQLLANLVHLSLVEKMPSHVFS
jgi:hypothetical protein